MTERVVLLGGTGFTGGLVARELVRREIPFLFTGRDPEKLDRAVARLGGADHAVVDVTDAERLREVVRPGDVVVDCAGPFLGLGEPVVEACLEKGAHFLDTTGEQVYMKRVHDRFDGPAREADVAVVNAMAFEYALGDAACALAVRGLERPLRGVDVIYGWRGSSTATSRGTRASVLHVLGHRGFGYRRGGWTRERVARETREVEVAPGRWRPAVTFPSGEVLTVPRYAEVEVVRGWIVVSRPISVLVRYLGAVLPPVLRALSPVLEPIFRMGPEGPSTEQRGSSRFEITARAVGADGRARTCAVRGRDPYGVTAALLGIASERLLRRENGGREEGAPIGVLAPSQLLEPTSLLESLRGRGLGWEVEAD